MAQYRICLSAATMPPFGWARLTSALADAYPTGQLLPDGADLHLMLPAAPGSDTAMGLSLLVADLLSHAAAVDALEHVTFSRARVVTHGDIDEDGTDVDADGDVAHLSALTRLLMLDLFAATAQWQLHSPLLILAMVNAGDARPIIALQGLRAQHLIGRALRAGIDVTAERLTSAVEQQPWTGEWPLMVPALVEALVHGVVDDAFDDGETIHVEVVTRALTLISVTLIHWLADHHGLSPRDMAETLLLDAAPEQE